ncbi:MAG: helix-turn-helix domain-containing protein [Lachnospiraceae bacterium]|nr:helix-turn-helix domain-containing protein [Lachnospiraceae bacterium]
MFNQNKLRAQMVLKGMSAKDLSKALSINESTFYRKLQNDGCFTRQEINTMIQVLEIEDPADIFFAPELA